LVILKKGLFKSLSLIIMIMMVMGHECIWGTVREINRRREGERKRH
jgi:hypothetical protein